MFLLGAVGVKDVYKSFFGPGPHDLMQCDKFIIEKRLLRKN